MAQSYEAATLFTLQASGYEAGAQQVVRATDNIQRAQTKAAASSAKMGSGMGRTNQFISNLGYGLEDFSVGYQLGGMQMAMRGVTNNLSMMAMSIGGLYGALAMIGTVLAVSVLPGLSKMAQYSSAFGRLKEEVKGFQRYLSESDLAFELWQKKGEMLNSFRKTGSVEEVLGQTSQQEKAVQGISLQIRKTAMDLEKLRQLQTEMVKADQDEGARKNIFQKFAAGFNPATQDVSDWIMGTSSESLWNNTKEINEAFDSITEQLENKIRQLKVRHQGEGGILGAMLSESPAQFRRILNSNIESLENELLSPIDRRLKEIHEQATRLADQIDQSPLSSREKISLQDRVSEWQEQNVDKVFDENRSSTGTAGPLQTLMAGSSDIFATVRKEEVDLLRQIAKNTRQKSNDSITILR